MFQKISLGVTNVRLAGGNVQIVLSGALKKALDIGDVGGGVRIDNDDATSDAASLKTPLLRCPLTYRPWPSFDKATGVSRSMQR